MKKRYLLIMLITLFIAGAGLWAVPGIRASLTHQQPSNTGAASHYTTGSRVIPTVTLPTPPAHCDPKDIPSVALDPADGVGGRAIKPHLCSIPTFTEQDVRQYMSTISSFTSFRIQQISPHFTVTRILFVTNRTANDILDADTGVVSGSLVVCYVEVYGEFTVAPPFGASGNRPILHHGEVVFDGVTGNLLVGGVRA